MSVSVRPVPPAITAEGVDRRGRGRLILWSVLAGVALSVVWSFTFVDSVIGDNVANSLLGYDAKETAITGSLMGALFAFVSGLAGTFTACNIAAFSAIAPLAGGERRSATALLKPMGWLFLGMVAVSGTYGAIGATVGERIPQLSQDVIGTMPVRLLQSVVVFGVIGLIFVAMGLWTVGAIPNPLSRLYGRHPRAQLLILGGLIGAFLIGRPFPLFFRMFEYAASTNNAALGGLFFALQAIGNVLVMVILFLLLSYGTRGRFQAWLERRPGRIARFTAAAFLVAGTFTFTYWAIRVPSKFGFGWWPSMPWS